MSGLPSLPPEPQRFHWMQTFTIPQTVLQQTEQSEGNAMQRDDSVLQVSCALLFFLI